MPCYSSIQTVLIDVAAIEKAAQALGLQVSKVSDNRLTIKKDRFTYIDIGRQKTGEKFSTVRLSGSGDFESDILQPLVFEYAKVQVKAFAKRKGYTVCAGSQPGQLVLTQFK